MNIENSISDKSDNSKKQSPLISVIIPAYNAEKHIEATLLSVFNQTYQNIEVIVLDDGSSDNTLEILKKHEPVVKILTQKNRGVSAARNVASENAQGTWLAFIDSDDIWLPDKLTMQMSQLGDANWSHTNSVYFGCNESGKIKRSDLIELHDGDVFRELVVDNFITTSTILIKKEIFLAQGGFDESLAALEDWKLWLNLSQKEPLNYNNNVLTKYRVSPGSASRKAREVLPLHLGLIEYIFTQYKTELKHHTHLKREALYNSYSTCSYIAEGGEDYYFSFKCAMNALKNSEHYFPAIKRLIRTLLNLLTKKSK